ncbi:MAG: FIG01126328: hypothetical protein, partial [uncultured Solirubrobacteraceae bacterium]
GRPPGPVQRADRGRLRRLPDRDAGQQAARRPQVAPDLHGDAAHAPRARAPAGDGAARPHPVAVGDRPHRHPVLALLRAPRALRAQPRRDPPPRVEALQPARPRLGRGRDLARDLQGPRRRVRGRLREHAARRARARRRAPASRLDQHRRAAHRRPARGPGARSRVL